MRLLRGVTLLALLRAVYIVPEASGNPRLPKVASALFRVECMHGPSQRESQVFILSSGLLYIYNTELVGI